MPGVFDLSELVKRTIEYLMEGVVAAIAAASAWKAGGWGAALVTIMCRHSSYALTVKEST